MKNILLPFFLIMVLVARPQRKVFREGPERDFSSFKPRKIKLVTEGLGPVVALSFQPANITVLDFRFDDKALGFVNKRTPREEKLILEPGTCEGIELYLKKRLNLPATKMVGHELVAVIQKLWLSDDLVVVDQHLKKMVPQQSGIVMKVSYFLKSGDSYFPLYKFDSTIVDIYPAAKQAGYYLALAIEKSIGKLAYINADKIIESGKKYSMSFIKDTYASRFTLPVLSENPKKGVYLSFEEFRKNKPSITRFSVRSDGTTDNLYYKDESGKEVLLRTLYAMSDGTDFYIWASDNFYKLYRSGNTFNLYGSRYYHHPAPAYFIDPLFMPGYLLGNAAGMSAIVTFNPNGGGHRNMKRKMYFYQLDMENGTYN